MNGIERLRKLSEDLLPHRLWNILVAGTEEDWDCHEGDYRTVSDVLKAIADQIEREADVETVRSEAMEAWRWVCDHGGLGHVRTEWDRRSNLKRTCEKLRAKVERQQRHIELVQGKCKTRVHRIVELHKTIADMRPRLMPEGIEWPTVDGKPVDFVTVYEPSLGVLEAVSIYSNGACEVMSHDGIIKPVSEIHTAVPAADGEPLEVGQTVWDKDAEDDTPLTVVEVSSDLVRCEYTWKDGKTYRPCYQPDQLTHERPDSWERLERDANASTCTYFGANTKDCEICGHVSWECSYDKASDLVRRAKALAERGQ